MRVVLQNVASEDMVQLFDSTSTPVVGLADTDVTLQIRKEGESGFTAKALGAADFIDRGGGNYALQFLAVDFDLLGLFRYQLMAVTPGTFQNYEDSLQVVDEYPVFPADPPTINEQTGTPPGVSPNPVAQGASLTISGTNLAGATSVTIGGVSVPITGNTNDAVIVTVTKPDPPGTPGVPIGDHIVVVTTAGGTAERLVEVVLDPADIPGSGCVILEGYVFNPQTCAPEEGVGVHGRILDMPNIITGVGWTDAVVSVSTNSDGRFELIMPRSVRVEVSIPRLRYRRVFSTPDVVRADLFNEIP